MLTSLCIKPLDFIASNNLDVLVSGTKFQSNFACIVNYVLFNVDRPPIVASRRSDVTAVYVRNELNAALAKIFQLQCIETTSIFFFFLEFPAIFQLLIATIHLPVIICLIMM